MRVYDQHACALVESVKVLHTRGRQGLPGGKWQEVQASIVRDTDNLRDALTYCGDPVFAQHPQARRPYQCLVLASEHWRARGAVQGGPSWRLLVAAAEAVGETISEYSEVS